MNSLLSNNSLSNLPSKQNNDKKLMITVLSNLLLKQLIFFLFGTVLVQIFSLLNGIRLSSC